MPKKRELTDRQVRFAHLLINNPENKIILMQLETDHCHYVYISLQFYPQVQKLINLPLFQS